MHAQKRYIKYISHCLIRYQRILGELYTIISEGKFTQPKRGNPLERKSRKIQIEQLKLLVNELNESNLDDTLQLIQDHLHILNACHKAEYREKNNDIIATPKENLQPPSAKNDEVTPNTSLIPGTAPDPIFKGKKILIIADKRKMPTRREVETAIIRRGGTFMYATAGKSPEIIQKKISDSDIVIYHLPNLPTDLIKTIKKLCKETEKTSIGTRTLQPPTLVLRLRTILNKENNETYFPGSTEQSV